jgi:uncharacterized membrane protein YhaH (DUF805 family)
MKEFFTQLFSGTVNRKSYFFKTILAGIIMMVPVMMLQFGAGYLASSDQFFLLTILTALIMATIAIGALSVIVYIFSLDTKRMRSILSGRPNREIYVVLVSLWILAFILPFFGFFKFMLFIFLEPGFSHSNFYRKNCETPIKNFTNKIFDLTKKVDTESNI